MWYFSFFCLNAVFFSIKSNKQAEKYADLAYRHDRYNAKALVNKGNCLLIKGEFELSKQFYLEAIGVEADCVEAIYNLGLVNLKMAAYQEALQAFDKLHTIIPHNPEVRFFYKYFFCSTECVTALFNCICAIPFPGNLPDSKSIRANK